MLQLGVEARGLVSSRLSARTWQGELLGCSEGGQAGSQEGWPCHFLLSLLLDC